MNKRLRISPSAAQASALLALVLYPIVWLLLLPFRLVGIAVGGVFRLLEGILLLPARVLRGPRRA